jgi:nitrate/nitrite transport system ATP-binding protein
LNSGSDRLEGAALSFIELKGVAKRYGSRQVLKGVNLSVQQGEFVSIVGASASGKTTLLAIAAGLRAPDSGSVTLAGQPMNGFSRQASFVFQNYSLLPWFSTLENVRLAVDAVFPDWPRSRQLEHAKLYLSKVGLTQAAAKRPGQLSGGMRQRVAIARAFATEPEVLFLDEPFGALDALTRATLQDELATLCRSDSRPVTVLMITNSVDEAILLSDRIVTLTRGPGASVGTSLNVDLPRPRKAGDALKSEEGRRLRVSLIGALTVARSAAGGTGALDQPAMATA